MNLKLVLELFKKRADIILSGIIEFLLFPGLGNFALSSPSATQP
jgi:hypothetical protein